MSAETSGSVRAKATKQGVAGRLGRFVLWGAGGLVVLLLVLLAGFAYYTTTESFQRRVGKEVVSVLEGATGGRVELGRITFNLWRLAIEADGLVIHGLEGPGEAPYLAADKIFVHVKISSFFSHTAGSGLASHVGLNYLRVEQPRVHLIIDKNGRTNQPVPKNVTPSKEPLTDTLLDLKAKQVELVHGIALVNDRAIPFNLAAADLNATVRYLTATDRYGATVDLRDLRTQIEKQPEAKSSLHLEAEVGRDAAELTKFEFHSGEHSELQASAAIKHYNNPEWQAKLLGSLELKQVAILGGVDGLGAGSVELDLGGHNCYVAPAEAQKRPKLWQRLRSKREAAVPVKKTLPPDPDCQAGYLLVGSAKLHDASYRNDSVQLHDINGSAQLHITPTQLLLSALTGYLPGGGSATGELKIDNWLGEVPQNTPTSSATVKGATTTANKTSAAVTGKEVVSSHPVIAPVVAAHAYLTVTASRIPLRTMLDIASPKTGDLGFDTSFSGPVKAEWGGPATNIADTVIVDADVKLAPTGVRRRGALSDIPLSGQVLAHYDGRSEVVQITRLVGMTPQSTLTANGVLGVNRGDPLTALNVDLSVRDLGEYDQLLQTLGVTGNGKKGAAALPVVLHGAAQFRGTARGAIAKLDMKGHLEATDLEVMLTGPVPAPVHDHRSSAALAAGDREGSGAGGARRVLGRVVAPSSLLGVASRSRTAIGGSNPEAGTTAGGATAGAGKAAPPAAAAAAAPVTTDVHIDSLVADAEYTPAGLAVASSTIKRGTAVLHVAGAFKPRVVERHRVASYVWDGGTAIDASVQLANASVEDVLSIAGQGGKYPVTGTIAADGRVSGTLDDLNGGGMVSLVNGVAYGEPYESAKVKLAVQGKDVEASEVALRLHGMLIAGNGGYDMGSERLHAHVEAKNLQLSKFKAVQDQKVNADGVLSLRADANGTPEQPGLKANLRLAKVTVDGKPVGEVAIDAQSEGKLLAYTLNSTLVGAQLAGSGRTELSGNYQTEAKLTLAGLDISKPLQIFQPGGLEAKSDIAGTVNVSGPLKTPMALNGQALFSRFEVTAQGLTFKAAEPLAIGLRNGLATLESVHITGPDTDLHASGTAQVFGAVDRTGQPDPRGGRLDVRANGGISMALAHTFDPDFVSSGKVVFAVGAVGTTKKPSLTGTVEFQKVNLAVAGIPNGLSDMNGILVFNEDRLNVQTLTAMTGGGKLTLGGSLSYRNGLYADLTARGDAVRVRLYGLSSTANANLHLQGGTQSALLSGTVLLTRFGVGPDVDFAAFAGAGGVSAPPDPDAATNKIRLDVKVTSAPQLDFQNSYAKLAGTVDLTVRGTVADPSVLGRIQITDGSATFAGTTYQLQRGDVYFNNPVRIDPVVDLDATARVENYDVTVGLHGTTANLKPTYRSEPPLSEADVFALLALGRTQEEAQIYQEQQLQAGTDPTTSSLLGGALNATVSNRVSKLFGGGSVKIDPAFVGSLGNSSARITVQQQLSRQLTLTYATNVNSSAQQLIQVQYQVSPNVSIVAARDETGVFSVVYRLRRRYR